MSLSKSTIKSTYPLPVYNYRVTILDEGAAHVIGFSEVTGLNSEYQPVTYKHGLSFIMGDNIIPGMPQPVKLTLKKGLTQNGDFLQKWLDQCYADPLSGSGKRDMVIDLCDETGTPIIRWSVKQVLPVKLNAPTLTASSNDVAIISMELIAANLRVDYQVS